ncbi:MAG: hypothetical protein O7C39_01960 [Bacteroidetes bacterium]|nr:hypothetical protein [Bacteroidota bacterium]
MNLKRKRLTYLTIVLGLVVLVAAGMTFKNEVILWTCISKLAEGASYNPLTGEATLDYTSTEVLERDIRSSPLARVTVRNFPEWAGLLFSSPDILREYFLIPVPFKNQITVDYVVQLQIMDSSGSLSAVLFSSENGQTGWHVDFVTIRRLVENELAKNYPPKEPKRRKSPNYWFKSHQVPMRIEVGPDRDPAYSSYLLMKVFYDYGNENKPSNVLRIRAGVSGYFGFSWNRVKFTLLKLKVTGVLDKQAALTALKRY